MKVMEEIGKRLKRLRNEIGLKQGEFAKRIEISQGMLSGIENGNEVLSDRNMKLICLEFGVNLDWLQHGGNLPTFKNQELMADERELLEIYDKLIPENKNEIFDYIKDKLELQELRKKMKTESRNIGASMDFPLEPIPPADVGFEEDRDIG
jgi:transcriptional regulator with XRE-family HTH domain